jgi:hypothetical protein
MSDDATKLQSSTSGVIRILNPITQVGEQFCYVLLGGGGTATTPSGDTYCTVILPICRAINSHAHGDWEMPLVNTHPETQHNSRAHFAAQTGYVAIDRKNYRPLVSHIEEDNDNNITTHYYKNLRVSSDIKPNCTVNGNAHYNVISEDRTSVLQRPIITYTDNNNEWKPWEENFQWETTTDIDNAWLNYDIAACPTLDYSEVLVPGERVKVLRTETHRYYRRIEEPEESDSYILSPASCLLTIVEPPDTYTVEFEGTALVNEFGIWHKERMLTDNRADVVKTTIDEDYNIGEGDTPYDYWGFDTVNLHPNGLASWSFIKVAAFPKLKVIQDPVNEDCIVTTHVSRPELQNNIHISNSACNTRAYALWYKTDKNGVRYPILCNVESLTSGTSIETRKVNCIVLNYQTGECAQVYHTFKFNINREEDRLVLPTIYCAVNCTGVSI